jgi:hypothetical protein
MSSAGSSNEQCKPRGGKGAFMGNLIPVLSLFFIGYPLGRATIRTMVVGWFLILVATIQFFLSRYFQVKRSPARAT